MNPKTNKRTVDDYGCTIEDYNTKIDKILDELVELKDRRKALKFFTLAKDCELNEK